MNLKLQQLISSIPKRFALPIDAITIHEACLILHNCLFDIANSEDPTNPTEALFGYEILSFFADFHSDKINEKMDFVLRQTNAKTNVDDAVQAVWVKIISSYSSKIKGPTSSTLNQTPKDNSALFDKEYKSFISFFMAVAGRPYSGPRSGITGNLEREESKSSKKVERYRNAQRQQESGNSRCSVGDIKNNIIEVSEENTVLSAIETTRRIEQIQTDSSLNPRQKMILKIYLSLGKGELTIDRFKEIVESSESSRSLSELNNLIKSKGTYLFRKIEQKNLAKIFNVSVKTIQRDMTVIIERISSKVK